jgi:hypothetical protein
MREISRSISVPRWLRSVTLAAAAALLLITAPAQRADAVSLIAPGGTPAAMTASDALIQVRDGHGGGGFHGGGFHGGGFHGGWHGSGFRYGGFHRFGGYRSVHFHRFHHRRFFYGGYYPTTAIITTRTAGSSIPIMDRGASAAGIAGIIAAIGETCEKVHGSPSGALFRLRHCERSDAIHLVTTEAWIA